MKTMLVMLFLFCGQAIGQNNYVPFLAATQCIEYALASTNIIKAPLDILRENGKIPAAIKELRDSGELCATLGHQWHEGTSYGEDTDIARKIDCVWCKKVKKQVIKRQPATFWEDQP